MAIPEPGSGLAIQDIPGHMRRSLLNPVLLLSLLHAYVGLRLLMPLPIGIAGRTIGAALLLASAVLIPWSLRHGTRAERRGLAQAATWAGLIATGLFSTLLVSTLLRDVLLLGAHLILPARLYAPLPVRSALAVIYFSLVATAMGLLMARGRPRVVDVDVPVLHLPRALHGFLIAQISDVHVGSTIKRGFVESIVEVVNRLKADVIALTGDVVDGPVQQLAAHTAPLARLSARHGAFFVTGNHEYYSGEGPWSREMSRLGLRVLKNEHVVLAHDGASVVLAGVDDFGAQYFDPAQRSDPAAALQGAPADAGARILLAHQPKSASAAAAAGFDLQISGHTHGGQFWPWNLLVRYFQPFTGGLHRLKNLWVYVSRGTGYWGPPTRFGVPPEITLLRLVPTELVPSGLARAGLARAGLARADLGAAG
jgi:predicted MPP superfamily phosphohydrolase